ncbi:hypothetical protein [Paracoccus sp. (in: a-proteobacteria)]|uniref:hypothetical protein n=1 Tax=Paracoccus sp. TaxID=267 RepID=UPI00289CDB5F|nr:hypothetical protein [Paracoccus sp. (in: a-proteobacteria)]
MRTRTFGLLVTAALALAACGGNGSGSGSSGSAGSGLNPLGWFGGGKKAPATLDPDGGYPSERNDNRVPAGQIISARWEPLYEGGMLMVTALPATKGWWAMKLITETPMPEGRVRADENGVLRLRLVGLPPLENTFEASAPANPQSDRVTLGFTLSHEAMAGLREVVITGASNSISIKRR